MLGIVELRTRGCTRRSKLRGRHERTKVEECARHEACAREAPHKRRIQRRRTSYHGASARATRREFCLTHALSRMLSCELDDGTLARTGEEDEQVVEVRQDEFGSVERRRKSDDERLV